MHSILLAIPKPDGNPQAVSKWEEIIGQITRELPAEGVTTIQNGCWLIEGEKGLPFFGKAIVPVANAQGAVKIQIITLFIEKATRWDFPSVAQPQ